MLIGCVGSDLNCEAGDSTAGSFSWNVTDAVLSTQDGQIRAGGAEIHHHSLSGTGAHVVEAKADVDGFAKVSLVVVVVRHGHSGNHHIRSSGGKHLNGGDMGFTVESCNGEGEVHRLHWRGGNRNHRVSSQIGYGMTIDGTIG